MTRRLVQIESASPELVLVDPLLALEARAQLADPDDTLARLHPDPALGIERTAALRRLVELSDSEEFAERPRRYRASKFAAAVANWSVALALVVNERLYDWDTWLP